MLRALWRLVPFVLRARSAVLTGLAAIIAGTAVSLASPLVLKYVVDDLTQGVDRSRLVLYGLLLVGLAVVEGAFRYLTRKYLIGASRVIEYDLRTAFFAHLQTLPLAWFQAGRTGDVMSRAINDLAAVRMLVGPAVLYTVTTVLGFVLAIGLMVWIDPRLTLVALLPLPVVSVATHFFGRAIHTRFERIQAQLSDMSAVVQEALAGVRVVRAFRQEQAEVARFRASNDEYVARNQRLIDLQAAFYPSLTLCFGLSGVAVLWFGGRDVMSGRITLGDFVAFSRYLVMLAWPMIAFGWVINIVQRGLASWQRMLEVFDTPSAARPADLMAPAGTFDGAIEIRRLTFRYPGASVDALTDVSFAIAAGQTLALVGATGSGKSTIVQLVTRLHEPPPGTVFVDGRDVRDLPLGTLRRALGVVQQDPFLFSDTVAANLGFGLDDDPAGSSIRPRLEGAALAAGLESDLAGFPGGLDTMVGERGITLSGGQKQRVALARAVAVDPRVLILDDAMSAVDTATEEAILGGLRSVRDARTCIIVSHRVSTVRDADLIVVLDEGRVAESGTHDTLVGAGGLYAGMDLRQRLEREIESA